MNRAFCTLSVFVLAACHAEAPVTHVQPSVPLAVARQGSVEQTVALAGRVGPAAGTQTKLSFAVAGTVASIDARLGDRVDAGTPLARLDATSYALAAQQASADARAAAAGAAAARVDRVSVKLGVDRAELQRQERLYRAGIASLRDVQAAQATVAADSADSAGARAQVLQSQAQTQSAVARAQSANYDVARTTLRAPASGIVVGIFAQAGDEVDPTRPVVALAPAEQRAATLDAGVNDVARIAAGDPVHVRAGNRRWEGRVTGVGSAVDPATGLAVVEVDGVPSGIPAGTPIDATVVVGMVRGIVIPAGAVIEDPQTGDTLVFVQTRDKSGNTTFVQRTVTIDGRSASMARVVSGLHAGERVASQGAIDLLAPQEGGD
ncbi:MAG: efflux RND transporter periplasmic adaptor subunit [Candidatus Eremiobacteraeota bacterium]|nr:efflux RND transporter periplasmic adaptor subunit [Candidatus Eremiobacteraeota bacterium]MBV8284703.1 efflux RND transporter periplasmic adaptor subunit [Candidatus Eremiobacteraeota bacterium]